MNYYLVRVVIFLLVFLLILISMIIISFLWKRFKPSEETQIKTGKILFIIYSFTIISTLILLFNYEFEENNLMFDNLNDVVKYSFPNKKIINSYDMDNSTFVLIFSPTWARVIEIQKYNNKWKYFSKKKTDKDNRNYNKKKLYNNLGYYIVTKSNYSNYYLIRFSILKKEADNIIFKDNNNSILLDSALNNFEKSKYILYKSKYFVVKDIEKDYYFSINGEKYFIN